jgi:voltage-gated potassium channel
MNSGFRKLVLKKLLIPLVFIILILIFGYLGYVLIEGYTPVNAIYMLITTFSMVGYGEIQPLTETGRIFTMILIVAAFSIGLYAISQITTFFIDGELSKLLKNRRMNKSLQTLNDHYIVCGYGKTGKKVVEDLLKKKKKVVLIERNSERNEKLKDFFDENFIHIDGDATNDEVLLHAGIQNAKFLISVLETDAENLFVTLSAKDFNKNIKVITRVEEANSTAKFLKAGANHIISPIEIASERIVSLATSGSDFYDFARFAGTSEDFGNYKFSIVQILENSELVNKTYREANIPQRTHLVVIGFYSLNNELKVNPKADNKIKLGDRLLVFGKEEEINLLKKIAEN